MKQAFESKKKSLAHQFECPNWIDKSGLSIEELEQASLELEALYSSKAIIKAKTLELIAEHAKIAVDADDIFQDKLMGGKIMLDQRNRWETAAKEQYLPLESAKIRSAWKEFGAYNGMGDYGHTSPNSRLLLSVGFTGLLERVESAAQKEGLSQRQKDFYESCEIVLNAAITVAKRLSEAIEPHNKENAAALMNITSGAPHNIYEAMQLLILYFFLHEYVGATRIRTLGRLDVLLYPFLQKGY